MKESFQHPQENPEKEDKNSNIMKHVGFGAAAVAAGISAFNPDTAEAQQLDQDNQTIEIVVDNNDYQEALARFEQRSEDRKVVLKYFNNLSGAVERGDITPENIQTSLDGIKANADFVFSNLSADNVDFIPIFVSHQANPEAESGFYDAALAMYNSAVDARTVLTELNDIKIAATDGQQQETAAQLEEMITQYESMAAPSLELVRVLHFSE